MELDNALFLSKTMLEMEKATKFHFNLKKWLKDTIFKFFVSFSQFFSKSENFMHFLSDCTIAYCRESQVILKQLAIVNRKLANYILPSYTASFVNSIPSFLNVLISTADSMAEV